MMRSGISGTWSLEIFFRFMAICLSRGTSVNRLSGISRADRREV